MNRLQSAYESWRQKHQQKEYFISATAIREFVKTNVTIDNITCNLTVGQDGMEITYRATINLNSEIILASSETMRNLTVSAALGATGLLTGVTIGSIGGVAGAIAAGTGVLTGIVTGMFGAPAVGAYDPVAKKTSIKIVNLLDYFHGEIEIQNQNITIKCSFSHPGYI